MKQTLVCIIGTDGSGKTTLADAAVSKLVASGHDARRAWMGAESLLMKPARGLLKLFWAAPSGGARKKSGAVSGVASQRVNYAEEISRKNEFARRHPWAVRPYLFLVWADYIIQIAFKRWTHRKADVLVADRYLFDVAVNTALALGWSPDDAVNFVRRRLTRIRLPQVRIFLRVEPEVSVQRKDDIWDIDYLRLRLTYYDAIAEAFGFEIRDGSLPIDSSCEWLVAQIRSESARPLIMYVHANNHDIGGADKVLVLMAEHMREHARPDGGFRIAAVLRLQTSITDAYSRAGIPLILHRFVRPQTSKGIIGLIGFALLVPGSLWFFFRLFGRENPDIVHVNDLYDFVPAIAARLRGIPIVWHIRMIVMNDRMRRAFSKMISALAHASVSVSRAVRDHYFTQGSPGHKALVIHDLGNTNLALAQFDVIACAPRPRGIPDGGRLVVMVGRIEPWKGQDVFVEAVRRLSPELRKGNRFVLVGGGVAGKESYLESVREAAVREGILVLGERDDVPAILRSADISVHASVTPDPFPGVVIESLLSGAATIAARAGGAVEMIEDEVNGKLVEPGNSEALSDAIEFLLRSPESPRSRYGEAGRERTLALTAPQIIDSALGELYRKVHSKALSSGQRRGN